MLHVSTLPLRRRTQRRRPAVAMLRRLCIPLRANVARGRLHLEEVTPSQGAVATLAVEAAEMRAVDTLAVEVADRRVVDTLVEVADRRVVGRADKQAAS